MEYLLTEEEIKNLSVLHKKIKNKSDADKIKCLILLGKGWSWKDIEDIKETLLINESTISHLTKSYKNYGLKYLFGNNYKGNNRKITPVANKYYEKFSDFKQTVMRFFTKEIRKKRYRRILEKSVGRKFQIIESIA